MTLHIGIDLGTSTVKVMCGSQKFLIPSILGEPNPGWSGMSADKSLENNLIVIEEGEEYYVGELARVQSEVKRALASEGQMKSAEETFIAIKAAIALLIDEDTDIIIATGVPVATSLQAMKNLSRLLRGTLEIEVKNDATGEIKLVNAAIKKTLVLPEPYGTYYGTLKSRGEETAVDTVIIDIGHGSTDILTMYQGRPMRTASGSLVEATDTLTSRMAKALGEKTGAIIKPFDLMMTIRKGKETVMISGQTYSVKEIKAHYAKQISKIIIDEVMRLISTLPPDAFVEYYIIAGGGAHIFGEWIRQAIIDGKLVSKPEKVVIPDDPVLSNAAGFELVAKTQ